MKARLPVVTSAFVLALAMGVANNSAAQTPASPAELLEDGHHRVGLVCVGHPDFQIGQKAALLVSGDSRLCDDVSRRCQVYDRSVRALWHGIGQRP